MRLPLPRGLVPASFAAIAFSAVAALAHHGWTWTTGGNIELTGTIAEARLDYPALRSMPEEEAVATLTAIKGIGVWTAEIYLTTALGRADVFAPGDLALQEAARILFALEARPGEKAFAARAQAWSPWRGVAARLLWAYYREVKKREGL